MTTRDDFDSFFAGCLDALFFTDTGDEGQPPEGSGLADETRERLKADCLSFWCRMWFYLDHERGDGTGAMSLRGLDRARSAGQDFWLTRNGHGSGFWDGDWPKYGDMLTNLAEGYGQFDTYQGDDGLIYA